MAKILVTGAAGFIGRSLVRLLEYEQHDVLQLTSSDGDVADLSTWQNLPKVDHVFHLAGKSYVPDSWLTPEVFLKTNLHGTWQALEFCRKNNADMTYVSAYIYGAPQFLPITENHPIEPSNPYALSKFMAEEACKFYAKTNRMNVAIIRPFNVYGPGQREEFLIPEIISKVISGKDIELKDLKPRRDYVYLDDVVDALFKTMKIASGLHIVNIGSGESYSVAEVVEAVQAVAGTKLNVVSENIVRQQEISETIADISEANHLLGWKPQFSLMQGITKVLEMEAHN